MPVSVVGMSRIDRLRFFPDTYGVMSLSMPAEDPQTAAIRRRIEQWRRAAPVLQAQREQDIRNADTQAAIAWFDGISRTLAPDTTRRDRGLVEQQRLFAKLRTR